MTPALEQEDVLRAIAHEIRQPLSAIESIAYYLSLRVPRVESISREQLSRIRQLVDQSNWILANGLRLSEPQHRATPAELDVEELITQTVSSWTLSGSLPAILHLAGDLPLVRLDPVLGTELIENVLTLFRQLATPSHPAHLRTASVSSPARVEIEMSTSVAGYRSIQTLPPGSALSLNCAKRIAELHGGSCTIAIDPVSGILVRVMLP
jgi:signal transduction histidine kinase